MTAEYRTLGTSDNSPDWFYPEWAADAPNNQPKPGAFPDDQAVLENRIRSLRAQGNSVTAEDIDTVEKMAEALNLKLLTTPPDELLEVTRLNDYKFNFTDMFGDRGDIINKHMPR